ncbi:hypothetical protein [Desulfurivibrio alkaliphilus]|uniref:Uncharacterized protein n=1 Tax=Desulfurivibrio alkaliphilus (strain DSM 19089 / UNIQEM U267 / AHT2) TaxID=589865 RepID=D6Z070_DESAT|nr:hypothetical protein [Desulfurivibrio alkaliphilus]ADH87103.1 conserved hypothetical protein [Desulfurivibrio alkaliphilus AHT 2]
MLEQRENLTIDYRKQQNAVHLRLSGDFDGPAAFCLVDFLQARFIPGDRVFIGTDRLHRVAPSARSALRALLRWVGVPAEAVFFKGSKAHALAFDGSRVIAVRASDKCGCGKNCANCGGKNGQKKSETTRDEQVN